MWLILVKLSFLNNTLFLVSGVSVPFFAITATQGRQVSENPTREAKLCIF
jgi:hypothetical protein